jgi:hypothetical protein
VFPDCGNVLGKHIYLPSNVSRPEPDIAVHFFSVHFCLLLVPNISHKDVPPAADNLSKSRCIRIEYFAVRSNKT